MTPCARIVIGPTTALGSVNCITMNGDHSRGSLRKDGVMNGKLWVTRYGDSSGNKTWGVVARLWGDKILAVVEFGGVMRREEKIVVIAVDVLNCRIVLTIGWMRVGKRAV